MYSGEMLSKLEMAQMVCASALKEPRARSDLQVILSLTENLKSCLSEDLKGGSGAEGVFVPHC